MRGLNEVFFSSSRAFFGASVSLLVKNEKQWLAYSEYKFYLKRYFFYFPTGLGPPLFPSKPRFPQEACPRRGCAKFTLRSTCGRVTEIILDL